MGLFDKFRGRGSARKAAGHDRAADLAYLRQWVAQHTGVEAFVEPKTTVTEVTVVLVAADGEWTRRRVGSPQVIRQVAKQLQLPVYDVQIVGYPERMRAYNARLKASHSERILGDEAPPPVRTSRPPGRTPRPPRESQP